jgi:hypothetical protein
VPRSGRVWHRLDPLNYKYPYRGDIGGGDHVGVHETRTEAADLGSPN